VHSSEARGQLIVAFFLGELESAMNGKICRILSWMSLIFVNLFPISLMAQLTPNPPQASATVPQPNGAYQSAPQSFQAVSQTGLLPLFAVDMQFDPSWVDGDDFPSKSAKYNHSGVNDTFQKAWDALKPGGFNMIRFPVEPTGSHAAARLANLCIWAKANNVSLIPILKGAGTSKKDKLLAANDASTFLSALVSRVRAGDAQQLAAYTQISYFQIEEAVNHLGLYPKVSPEAAQQVLLNASDALRKAETLALQGAGVQPTPIMVSASFDYDLIGQGAIAGVPLDSSAEQKAQASLKQFLSPLATAASIDAVNVEWFPRSISSGDVDHFAALLRALKVSLPDKHLTLTTGFSDAFNPIDQQMRFYTLTVSNLGDYRASDGVNSNFLGVVFRQAFKGADADAKAPAGSSDPNQWDWSSKAQQLFAMWTQGTVSEELSWWLSKVQDNMGLLTLQPNGSGGMNVVPLPAQQAFQQISTTVAQVSQNVVPPATAFAPSSFTPTNSGPATVAMPQSGMPAYAVGAQPSTQAQTAASPFQQMLFTILQQFTTQMTSSLVSRLAGSPGQATQTQYPTFPAASSQNFANPSPQQPPYGTPTYGANPPVQSSYAQNAPSAYPNQAPTSPSSPASGVWLGPQDINVDTTNAAVGQPVRITAQIHNGSTDQDVSGLTVQLVDPSNATPNNQTIQRGVAVPRSGVTPVQLSWIPSQPSAGQVQLVLQVLSPDGSQIANTVVPAITVANTFSGGSAGSALNPNIPSSNSFMAPASQAPAIPPAQGANSPGVQSAPPDALSTAPPLQAGPVQPQITYFGATDASLSATTAQIPPLSLQIANPSNAPMQPAQAQLFVDGAAQQVQALGPLLPKQTRSAVFAAIPAPSGPHALQVVVTTADGATASGTSSANVAPPTVSNTTTGPVAPPSSGNNVRSGTPTKFTIGAVSHSTTVSQRPPTLTMPSSASQLEQPRSTFAAAAPSSSIAPASTTGPAATPNPSNTNLPTRPGSTGTPNPSASPSVGTPTLTITPGSAVAAPPTSVAVPTKPGPTATTGAAVTGAAPTAGTASTTTTTSIVAGALGNTASPSTGAPTRTITPGPAAASPPTSVGVPARPGPTGTTGAAPTGAAATAGTGTSTTSSPSTAAGAPRTILSPRPGPTGATGNTASPSTGAPTRTITPGSVAAAPSTSVGVPARPGPMGTTGAAPTGSAATAGTGTSTTSSPSTAAGAPRTVLPPRPGSTSATGNTASTSAAAPLRTITPGSAAAAPPTSVGVPARPGPTGGATTTPPAPAPAPGRPATATASPATAPANLDLSVTMTDIHFSPVNPRAGQSTTFTAVVRNLGTSAAQGASVMFRLLADGRQAAISQPVVFNIAAHGIFQASWSTPIPAGQHMQVVVSVNANGDVNPANNQATVAFAGAPANSQPARR